MVHRHPGPVGAILQAAQRVSTKPLAVSGSHFTHAGVYVGSGRMVDATFGRPISEVSVWNYCQTRQLQVRRLSDPSIPQRQIDDIAFEARAHIGEPYSTLALLLAKLWPGTVPLRKNLYCSTFVGLVVADATGVRLANRPNYQPLLPSILGLHPDLTAVPVEWRSL